MFQREELEVSAALDGLNVVLWFHVIAIFEEQIGGEKPKYIPIILSRIISLASDLIVNSTLRVAQHAITYLWRCLLLLNMIRRKSVR